MAIELVLKSSFEKLNIFSWAEHPHSRNLLDSRSNLPSLKSIGAKSAESQARDGADVCYIANCNTDGSVLTVCVCVYWQHATTLYAQFLIACF